MQIDIRSIDASGLALSFEEAPERFPLLADMHASGECEFRSPIRIHARLIREGDLFRMDGRVETRVGLTCGRCLKTFETLLSETFALTFVRKGALPDDSGGPLEKELMAEEIGLVDFSGERIDLSDAIQEQVILMLPQRPLCSESCKGLCPRCGTDLNAGGCGCEPPGVDDRLAVLKQLKIGDTP